MNAPRTWTVTGTWCSEGAHPVAAIEGEHAAALAEPDTEYGLPGQLRGNWAVTVTAPDAQAALNEGAVEAMWQEYDRISLAHGWEATQP
jgi:hypothetical protein